jgi:hypothetical protein
MQTSHAPGQWVVKSLSVYTDYGAGHRHKVADTRQPLFTRECQEANARLIAAAPDLLAALQAIMGDPDAVDHILHLDAVAADAAIAKATGGQP